MKNYSVFQIFDLIIEKKINHFKKQFKKLLFKYIYYIN